MPFEPGTEIACNQGNNSMAMHTSHAPHQLRYALDLNAPLLTRSITPTRPSPDRFRAVRGPVPFSMSAIDLTAAAATAKLTPSTEFACGEAGWLPGAAHIYRAP